jgi:signal transduction histidine kinase
MGMQEGASISPRLEETKDLTRQLIADLKSVSANLNGPLVARLGLAKGIENEVERLKRLETLKVVYTGPEIDLSLTEQKSIIVLRMFQELLNNTLKHSQASEVKIVLEDQTNAMILMIQDNGIGFDFEKAISKGGSGLHNLQSRAELIGALFSIDSTPAQGSKTTIKVTYD